MTSRASLNHIFRTVWNQALGAMVAVAEISGSGAGRGSASCGPSATRSLPRPELPLGALAVGIALAWSAVSPALANPTGAVAIVGQATLSNPGANQLLVTTQNGVGTNHSSINWQSFSVPQGSSTYFAQPSASSTSINRVVSNTPSAIFGTLGSNGKLVLVNQSGIAVGTGAVVDTAGFTASALAMSDADAIAGRLRFGSATPSNSSVDVQGSILARGGDVVLIGSQLNTGKDAIIQAPNGSAILAAGQQVEITGRGLEGIVLQVQAPTDQAVNLGSLQGNAVGMFAGTLKHSGAIQANAVTVEGGKVVLKALDMADVDGQIKAQGSQGQGGSVQVTADKTVLRGTAAIDTSNTASGGDIRIGGGWHGDDTSISNAKRTVVLPGASLKADATDSGNGGTVVVWADEATGYAGNISAKGGANGGDGGKVEVSGKQYLDFQGTVDTTAAKGKNGSLLLDPDTITINAGPADVNGNGTTGDDVTGDITSGQYPGYGSVITATAVGTLLNSGNLTLGAVNGITVAAPISSAGAHTLSLQGGGGPVDINSSINMPSGQLHLQGITVSQAGGADITASAVAVNSLGSASLGAAGNNIGTIAANVSGGGFTFANFGEINIGTVNGINGFNLAGPFALSSTNGGVAQTQPITAVGASTISVNAGPDVVLTNAANNFDKIGVSSAASVYIKNSGLLYLNGITAGSLSVEAGGNITELGASSIDVPGGATFTTSGVVHLPNFGNNLRTLNVAGASTVSIQNDGNLALGNITITGGGQLNLDTSATNGSISTSGTVNITGGSMNISAGTGSVAITTTSSSNSVFTVYDVHGSSVNLQLSSDSQIWGAITSTSGGVNISTNSGYINMTSGYGSIVSAAGINLHSNFYLGLNNTSLQAGAGGDVVLRTENDLFASGPSITTSGGGRMLVYVGDPGAHVYQLGSLPALAFKQYNTLFGGAVLGSGNGVIYNNSTPATLTGTLTGAVSKIYDGSTSISLAGASVGSVNASVAGDTASVSLTGATGTLADPNVGSNKLVTVSGATVMAHDTNSLPVYGYLLSGISGNIGQVNPATPIISLSGERFYDGTNIVNAGIFTLSGLVNGETLGLTGAGSLFDKNAGVNKPVNLGSLSLTNGTGQASNYTFDGGTFMATILPLTIGGVSGLTAANKVYDGTTKASIDTSKVSFTGVLSGDVVGIASATGSFANKNAGTGKTVTITNLNFGGADAQNYKFDANTSTTTTADISKANISAISGLAVNNKTYDGSTTATLASGAPVLTGAIAGDNLSVSATSASFADKNAGASKAVTITGIALSGTDAQNYTLSAPTSASTSASISKATLTGVSGITGVNKTYDGTTVANIDASHQSLSGAVANDNVSLQGIQSSFADKNAGASKTINLSGFSLGGTDAGNYNLGFSTANTTASISPAVLQLSGVSASNKVYDGTTKADVTIANATLSGIIGNDSVSVAGFGSAAFADKNVGTNKPVTITGLQFTGADAGNYSVTGNTNASASITPLAQANWKPSASAGGLWSNPANWDVLPDGNNVLSVSIPAGTGPITFDAAMPATSLQSLTTGNGQALTMAGSALTVASSLNLASYSQSGGSLTGGASMNVSNGFNQSGGSLNLTGALVASQVNGNMQLASITAPSITLTAPSISQSAGLTTNALNTTSTSGTNLTAAGNKIAGYTGSNSTSGDISLTNGVPISIASINNAGGNIAVNNTGAVTTLGAVTAKGSVTGIAHSPLTIGPGGVQAGGDITLTAGASAGQDDLTINGPIASTGGNVVLNAGDNLLQNANVSAPAGAVTANVVGLISGSGVSTGKDVHYSSGGVTVPPPGSASVTVIQTLVTTFTDSFKQDQSPANTDTSSPQDPASKDKKTDDLVVAADSSLCK